MLLPDQQRELGDLMNHAPAAAERVWRQLAKDLATDQFGFPNAPQSIQEVAEVMPFFIDGCCEFASHPIAPGRVQQMKHAARSAFYERLCSLADAAEDTKGGSA